MSLTNLICNAALSVDAPGTDQETRFNGRERRQIWQQMNRSSNAELRAALSKTGEKSCIYVDSNVHTALEDINLWRGNDAQFRADLCTAIQKRLKTTGSTIPPPPSVLKPREKLPQSKIAVLLVDADYSHSRFPNEDIEAEKANMAKVLDEANNKNMLVVEIVTPGTFQTDAQFTARRKKDNWIRLEKINNGAFYRTNLEDELRARGVETVVVMGLYQEYCVASTCQGASQADFAVYTSPLVVQSARGQTEITGWGFDFTAVSDPAKLPVFDPVK